MKKIFLTAVFFLFFNPFVIQADDAGVRSNLNKAAGYVSEAETYAVRAYSTSVLEQAQFNARKAEKAAAEAQTAIQNAMTNLQSPGE